MIRDILLLQRRELEDWLKETYIERDVAVKDLQSNIIKVVIGPRRAGKSVFSIHLLSRLGNFGYVNFDDEKLVETKDYDEIISAVNSVYDNPKYLLLDEIQNLEKWELFVNRLQRQGYRIVITGSNSRLLSRELATHLTGRYLPINLFTFSFREFLESQNKELTESEKKAEMVNYLTFGGYPEPLVKKLNYRDYLSTLFNSIVYKDIVRRYRIRSVQAIEDLSSFLISNVSKEYSYNTLKNITRTKSPHTVEKYIGYLEEAFILFNVSRFSFKLKEQIGSNKKIYCFDNGLIHAKAFKINQDIGKLYENAVAIQLKKMEIEGPSRIFYWKDQKNEEVDFIVKEGPKIKELIQVCYDLSGPETKQREIRSLLKASKELKCSNLLVITNDYESEEQAEWFGIKGKVRYVPLWKWLLK